MCLWMSKKGGWCNKWMMIEGRKFVWGEKKDWEAK